MSDVAGETIVVDETGKGDFQDEVKPGTSTFLMDEPVQAGGLGSGPNPYDLLSAAIGACASMTIRLYARPKQWPLERVRLKVAHHRDSLQAKDRFVPEIESIGPLDEAQ
jgi:putative redox protein